MKFFSSKHYVFWILAICLLVFAAFEIAEAKKPTKPPQEEPLELYGKNIVTTTPIGEIMRVWGYVSADPVDGYQNIWTKEGERYKAVAIGDINGDNTRELYAASVNYVRRSGYRIVVDVYIDEQPGVQLGSPPVWDRSCVGYELILADVCGDSDIEIILSTDHNVVVFGYDGNGEIVQLAYKEDIGDGTFEDQKYWIYAMAVADVNGDSKGDILLGVNPVGYEAGYLFIYELVDSPPDSDGLPYSIEQVSDPYQCSDGRRILSLATGDSDSVNGPDKICATAFEYLEPGESIYQNYLLIWSYDNDNGLNLDVELPIGGLTSDWFSLDVGDVLPGCDGDEIALIRNDQEYSKLKLRSLNNGSIIDELEAPVSVEEANLNYV